MKYSAAIATFIAVAGTVCYREDYHPFDLILLWPGILFTWFIYRPRNWRVADAVMVAATWVPYFVFVYASLKTFVRQFGSEDSK